MGRDEAILLLSSPIFFQQFFLFLPILLNVAAFCLKYSYKIGYLTPCIHCTDYSIRVYQSYQYSGDIKQRVTSSLIVYITLFLGFSTLNVANKLHFAQICSSLLLHSYYSKNYSGKIASSLDMGMYSCMHTYIHLSE